MDKFDYNEDATDTLEYCHLCDGLLPDGTYENHHCVRPTQPKRKIETGTFLICSILIGVVATGLAMWYLEVWG